MKHFMMLSDLYGRIGQMLAEHGDAPIGVVEEPLYHAMEPSHPLDWVEPHYVEVAQCVTEIGKVKIKTYNLLID